MKIAFDVDGVITEEPEFYSVLSKSLMATGHEIYIISDFDEHFRKQREKELARYGIEYSQFIITANKIDFCRENGIDYAIDDDISYYPKVKRSDISLFSLE